jgi:outer membrane biosynthesis protein TonB
MIARQCGCFGVVVSAIAFFSLVSVDRAVAQDRRQECSDRYKSAKAEGNLGGLTWPQFFSRCIAELKAAKETPAEMAPSTAEPVESSKAEPTPAAPPPREEAASPAVETPTEPVAASEAKPLPTPAPAEPTAPPPPAALATAPAPTEAVFPKAVAPAYAKEKLGIARRKTCQDQFNANKATDSNGGLKWVQKGGGYMVKCMERLKEAS